MLHCNVSSVPIKPLEPPDMQAAILTTPISRTATFHIGWMTGGPMPVWTALQEKWPNESVLKVYRTRGEKRCLLRQRLTNQPAVLRKKLKIVRLPQSAMSKSGPSPAFRGRDNGRKPIHNAPDSL